MAADGRAAQQRQSGVPMARIRIIFSKVGLFTFVNHMDLPLIFSRAARRAGLSQEFTKGFSPHPRISLASPLAVGVEGYAEPADFWFTEWHEDACSRWSAMLPDGLKILKCAEVEEGLGLAKQINAAVYRVSGADAPLDERAMQVLSETARSLDAFRACSLDDGVVTLSVGNLEHCGAGQLVKALVAAEIVSGWQELHIARLTVGKWDASTSSVMPLI